MEKLLAEINELYKSISTPLDRTAEGLLAELDYRCQWLARSAELEADAQHYLDQKRGALAERYLNAEIPATLAKEMLNAASAEERKVFQLADRLNATLTHQIDAIRSILSFEKESRKREGGT